mmetsp:Transcript_30775/g.82413  ORF Transcript_30775/g.82413 Transcript_30775/m.82413 type:complete len:217 (-) Transcript_30775:1082-1732(-)
MRQRADAREGPGEVRGDAGERLRPQRRHLHVADPRVRTEQAPGARLAGLRRHEGGRREAERHHLQLPDAGGREVLGPGEGPPHLRRDGGGWHRSLGVRACLADELLEEPARVPRAGGHPRHGERGQASQQVRELVSHERLQPGRRPREGGRRRRRGRRGRARGRRRGAEHHRGLQRPHPRLEQRHGPTGRAEGAGGDEAEGPQARRRLLHGPRPGV